MAIAVHATRPRHVARLDKPHIEIRVHSSIGLMLVGRCCGSFSQRDIRRNSIHSIGSRLEISLLNFLSPMIKKINFKSQRARLRSASKKGEKSEGHWLILYARKNLLKSLAAFATVFGLCLIYAYHFHIEYFPKFDIQSLSSMVFGAAYVGVSLLSLVGIVIIMPAVFIGAFCFEGIEPTDKLAIIARISVCFFTAFFAFFVLTFLFFVLSTYDLSPLWLFLVFPLFFFGYLLKKGVFLEPWRRLGEVRNLRKKQDRDQEKIRYMPEGFFKASLWWMRENRSAVSFAGTLSLASFLQVLPLTIYLLMISNSFKFSKSDFTSTDLYPIFFSADLIIQLTGAYFVASWRYPGITYRHKYISCVVVLFSPLLIAFFGGNQPFFWSAVAHTAKIGNFRASEITLNAEGCDILAEPGLSVCSEKVGGSYKICGAHVMSSIGTEIYLKIMLPQNSKRTDSSRDKIDGQTSQEKKTGSSKPVVDYPGLRDVYMPAKDILGMKVDTSTRYFDMQAINAGMKNVSSICPAVEKIVKDGEATLNEKQLFQFDKFELLPVGELTLEQIVKKIGATHSKNITIDITGYADQIGSPHHNMTLSELRALSVESFLREKFLSLQLKPKIIATGAGSSALLRNEKDCPSAMKLLDRIECFAPNRRVEIRWASQ